MIKSNIEEVIPANISQDKINRVNFESLTLANVGAEITIESNE